MSHYGLKIVTDNMTSQEIADYIKSKNLDIRTVEQIVSFFYDKDIRFTGDKNWWEKKEIVRYVHKEKFSEIWPLVIAEFDKRKK